MVSSNKYIFLQLAVFHSTLRLRDSSMSTCVALVYYFSLLKLLLFENITMYSFLLIDNRGLFPSPKVFLLQTAAVNNP